MGNACLLKIAEEHPKNLLYLTAPLRDPIRKEANATTNNSCISYNYERRTGMMKR
jgi:hypothetical protein